MKCHLRLTALSILFASAALSSPALTDWRVGDSTPSFTLPMAGTEAQVALLNEVGVPMVLLFADPAQENSLQALDELEQIIAEGEFGEAVKVFVIVPTARSTIATRFPTLLDPDRDVFADYGVVAALPSIVFLDADGLFHWSMAGHGVAFRDAVQDEIEFLAGRIDEAELMRRRSGPEPQDLEALDRQRRVRLADLALQRGLVEQAQELYQAVLEEAPGNAEAHLGLARIALHEGNVAAALEQTDIALASQPDLPVGLKTRAQIALLMDDHAAAATAIASFVELAGDDAESHYIQARIAENRGDSAAALQHYRAACENLLAHRGWGVFTDSER